MQHKGKIISMSNAKCIDQTVLFGKMQCIIGHNEEHNIPPFGPSMIEIEREHLVPRFLLRLPKTDHRNSEVTPARKYSEPGRHPRNDPGEFARRKSSITVSCDHCRQQYYCQFWILSSASSLSSSPLKSILFGPYTDRQQKFPIEAFSLWRHPSVYFF